jgi:MFS family permease
MDSFLPLAKGIPSNLASAALLVQAITATLSRWQAGKRGDRYGQARLLVPALAVAALGMATMMLLGSPLVIFAGMVLFGAGFGVVENVTFALLIEQLPEAKASATAQRHHRHFANPRLKEDRQSSARPPVATPTPLP